MKDLWIQIAAGAKDENLQALASQYGDAVVDDGRITLTADKTEIVLTDFDAVEEKTLENLSSLPQALRVVIKGKDSENLAVHAAELGVKYLVINCMDWRVIPLENLIAKTRGKSKLIAEVANAEDARVVLETLELGTDGVLLKTANADELLKTVVVAKPKAVKIEVATAKIAKTKPIGNGARVCVDTCDLMEAGEGLLVGSQSAGLFLVEAEVHENPYVASRPFRVNAGSLSMYTLGSLQNTRYLSELKAGDEVIIVNREGETRKANVGRVKIEIRPLMLVEAEVEGKTIKTILQNAETIRVVTPKGSTPVTELKVGDEVLVHLAAKGGRHFGVSVTDETVIER
ncbi:MAG: 3-dehydroquinate synthase II [Candidatus Bathyarchaeota archaeon]|nr:3-dehydroquinate synthase II [Candidatus Bathyarchaeota archaeon]